MEEVSDGTCVSLPPPSPTPQAVSATINTTAPMVYRTALRTELL